MSRVEFGMESVKRQDDSFFNALTASMKKLRHGKDFTTAGIKKCHVMQVIKEHTGLNVIFFVEPGWRACVYPPRITANHIFNGSMGRSPSASIIDVTKTTLKGTIDVANVRVTGVFAELASELFIGTALFAPGKLNDRQVAGILLHEIGHIFTHFQFLSTIAYGSVVVEQTIQNIFLSNSYQAKEVHLKAAVEVLGLEDDTNITDWVDTSKENLEVIMITRFYRQLTYRSSTCYYDVRNCEQLADVFAAKHGAAVYLAQANHKLDKELGLYGSKNFFVHVLNETTYLMDVIFSKNYSVSKIMLSMRQPKDYDDPKDRIAFLKFHLIDDLKHLPRGDNKTRANLVKSISEIDNILNSIDVRRDVFTYVHETFRSFGKSASNREKQQKQLEEMLYNDLYYQSAKLKTLNQE